MSIELLRKRLSADTASFIERRRSRFEAARIGLRRGSAAAGEAVMAWRE
jgi:hypothetical protein